MRRISRVASIIMTGMFSWFAALQYNDVDAALWIAAYGIAAVLSGCDVVNSRSRFVAVPARLMAAIYGVWGLTLLTQTRGQWWDGEIEREVGGLIVSALWMIILSLFPRSMSRSD